MPSTIGSVYSKKCYCRKKVQKQCARCNNSVINGKTRCTIHADIDNKNRKKHNTIKKAEGKCRYCKESVVDGRNQCQTHLDRQNNYSKQKRTKRKVSGVCIECGIYPFEFESVCSCGKCYLHSAYKSSKRHGWQCIITVEEIRKAWTGSCFYCDSISKLHLDHDHITGKFRNWLCGNCNRRLGVWEHMSPKMKEMLLQEVVQNA